MANLRKLKLTNLDEISMPSINLNALNQLETIELSFKNVCPNPKPMLYKHLTAKNHKVMLSLDF